MQDSFLSFGARKSPYFWHLDLWVPIGYMYFQVHGYQALGTLSNTDVSRRQEGAPHEASRRLFDGVASLSYPCHSFSFGAPFYGACC
jgi:hypothetical protein